MQNFTAPVSIAHKPQSFVLGPDYLLAGTSGSVIYALRGLPVTLGKTTKLPIPVVDESRVRASAADKVVISGIATSDDRKRLFAVGWDGALCTIAIDPKMQLKPKILSYISAHSGFGKCIAISDQWIVTGSGAGDLALWRTPLADETEPTLVSRVKDAHSNAVNALVAISERNLVVSLGTDRALRLWRPSPTGLAEIATAQAADESSLLCGCWCPALRTLFVGSADSRVCAWRVDADDDVDPLRRVAVLELDTWCQAVAVGGSDASGTGDIAKQTAVLYAGLRNGELQRYRIVSAASSSAEAALASAKAHNAATLQKRRESHAVADTMVTRDGTEVRSHAVEHRAVAVADPALALVPAGRVAAHAADRGGVACLVADVGAVGVTSGGADGFVTHWAAVAFEVRTGADVPVIDEELDMRGAYSDLEEIEDLEDVEEALEEEVTEYGHELRSYLMARR